MLNRLLLIAAASVALLWTSVPESAGAETTWSPAEGPLKTPWAEDLDPEAVLPEYPRPQMVRDRWTNLNGLWDYAIRPRGEGPPDEFEGEILVPFAVESALSGVAREVGPENRLWYRRVIEASRPADGGRLLLHFGAVDWEATVWVNGQEVGTHRGGYDPFALDITDALRPEANQEIVVAVWDPTDAGFQPRGKQVREPEGIWYTSVTGIWQTVWLEEVPPLHIASLKLSPDVDTGALRVDVTVGGEGAPMRIPSVRVTVREGGAEHVAVRSGNRVPQLAEVLLTIPAPRLWSPDDPFLYDDVTVELLTNNEVIDRVSTYFGMRKIEVGEAEDGFNRLLLNGEPLFQFGLLDQGWWPDGLYTAPTDEALRYDIEVTRQLGFNMARKHVKVEPARWYYWCDRLGLLVWQDMPNGDRHIPPGAPDIERTAESEAVFRQEWQAILSALQGHPSIVVWVPFNEGWGQFKTNEILDWTKQLDPTRLVGGPSGWEDRGGGDLHDMHRYPGPAMPEPETRRAVVLGEFGGLGLPVEGHLWWDKRNWGYRTYETAEELEANYKRLIRQLRPLVGRGLAAAIYTQTTDVEGEVNGLLTYDRKKLKLDAERIEPLHRQLYGPPPQSAVLLPTSERAPQDWQYTTVDPGEGWYEEEFDASEWKTGPGGFGTQGTPGAVVRTEWSTSDIWIRRSFELVDPVQGELILRMHHDEDAEVYLNGQHVLSTRGYISDYADFFLDDAARAALRTGRNTIAIHCHQTEGGQYIDAGLVEQTETVDETSEEDSPHDESP